MIQTINQSALIIEQALHLAKTKLLCNHESLPKNDSVVKELDSALQNLTDISCSLETISLLERKYGTPNITFNQTCEEILHITPGTGRNLLSKNTFPFPTYPLTSNNTKSKRYCHIKDIAIYIDEKRNIASF